MEEKERATKYNYQRIVADKSEVDDREEPEPTVRAVGNEQIKQPQGENPVLSRYRDLYRIARLQVKTGNIVKIIGIVVGIGSLLIFIPGILAGGIVYLLGILISAQGQMLLVHADSAVHTSPFMTNDEKAKVMSLSFPPAVTQIVDG